MREEPFDRLRPLLADFPAPVTDIMDWGLKKPTFLLSASIDDVIDRAHVLVETNASTGSEGAPIERLSLVLLDTRRGWTVTRPTLPRNDQQTILRKALFFLLAHKEYGYREGLAYSSTKGSKPYVALMHQTQLADRGGQIVDPPATFMRELWKCGYHLKPISELPTPSPPGHPPPYCSFQVGDLQPIDAKRALVHLSQTFFSMEPGYNIDYGPSTTHFATYLVVKRGREWRIDSLRYYWSVDPAE